MASRRGIILCIWDKLIGAESHAPFTFSHYQETKTICFRSCYLTYCTYVVWNNIVNCNVASISENNRTANPVWLPDPLGRWEHSSENNSCIYGGIWVESRKEEIREIYCTTSTRGTLLVVNLLPVLNSKVLFTCFKWRFVSSFGCYFISTKKNGTEIRANDLCMK